MRIKGLCVALFLSMFFSLHAQDVDLDDDPLGLSQEYSMDYFELGVRALQSTRYELAIAEFIKSLEYRDDNSYSRIYLGEAYRKAGYEKNALYTWNTLMTMGYESRFLKSRISYLYNRRGMLSDIFVDKNFVVRTDIKGYYDGDRTAAFLNPSQITVDDKNHYYITSFTGGNVVELDSNLTIVRNILTANPIISKPYGVAASPDGDLFVSDFGNDVVLKINRFNIVTQKIGFKGIGEGGLLGPKYITLDEHGNLFVVDSGNKRINKYSADGTILFSFGKNGEGKLEEPSGMFYKNGEIMVVDRKRNEVLVYDLSGNYLRSFGAGYVDKPYDITMDKLGRYIIVCETSIWVYEPESSLWYVIDSVGGKLKRGVSVIADNEDNILVSDFNSSKVLVLSLERRRYNNMYVGIERVISKKFPDVHLQVKIEKDDMSSLVGLTDKNLTVFENNKLVPLVGTGYTDLLNSTTDIAVIYDNNRGMGQYKNEIKILMDRWMRSLEGNTSVSLVTGVEGRGVITKPSGSTRLELMDAVESGAKTDITDKGDMIKIAGYDMLERFSKKSIVLITNCKETGNDFEQFKIEDIIQFALNNDIKIYVAAFSEGELSGVYRNMAERTGGDYFRAYQRRDLKDLFTTIEKSKSKYFVFSYVSRSISRFGREPVKVEVEINYNGMKGLADTIYYPPRE